MDKNDSSPLDTLRQLKEWLDAGAITQQEFNALKQKLLFPDAAPAAPAPPPVAPPVAPEPAVPTPPLASGLTDSLSPHEAPLVPEQHVVPPPADDPMLPPVVAGPVMEPVVYDPATQRPTEGPINVQEYYQDGPAEEPRRSPLGPILIIGGVLALLAVIAYLALGNRDSERLTSNSMTAADTTSVQIEEGPQAEQLNLPPVAAPETVRVQPNIPVAALPADSTVGATTAGPTDAAAAEAATRNQVQRTLTALYSDLQTAPFSAGQYFAPQVERFYSLQNTTPAGIEDELNRTHFPEFTESKISFVPGSLQISAPAEDGSVTVTYQERGRSLRKSLNQYQQTLAQVRARFDRSGKLTYFRQERLLENNFTDAKPAASATPVTPETAPQPQN